jgi:hypothetical protein
MLRIGAAIIAFADPVRFVYDFEHESVCEIVWRVFFRSAVIAAHCHA